MSRPQESIYIKNFGGIEEALISLNEINIFIGPQASGKSVTAKLVYFFKEIKTVYFHATYRNKKEILDKFYKYFPKHTWENLPFFEIKYNEKIGIIRFYKNINETEINFELIGENLGDNLVIKFLFTGFQIYVPAGRTFFATIKSNIFTLINAELRFDPFLVKFGSDYEMFIKGFIQNQDKISDFTQYVMSEMKKILKGKYIKENEQEYILHEDGRKIELSAASSGQQELTPISFLLQFLCEVKLSGNFPSIYIEEPEAHIYPETQKKLVELLVSVKNTKADNNQFTITTHSPYILTAFNNLIQAGAIEQEIENKEDLYKIVPQHQILKPNTVSAYEFRDGKVESLIDPETGFILAERLDAVSEELAIQFDQLLDLKYAVEK